MRIENMDTDEMLKMHVTRPVWSWLHTRIDLMSDIEKTGEVFWKAFKQGAVYFWKLLRMCVTFWRYVPMDFVHVLVVIGTSLLALPLCIPKVCGHIGAILFYPFLTFAAHRVIRRAALNTYPELRRKGAEHEH